MEETFDTLKEYFEKIKKTIRTDAIFSLFGYRLIKKQRIDDILCCIYTTFPQSYQKMLNSFGSQTRYKSIFYYKTLINKLKRDFLLNNQCKMIKEKDINSLIDNISINLKSDLKFIERREQEK